ncbi:prepilin-type N-terminal cleavage/methylation domain-containing protein [Acerihabitans sp. TG2]|uniref:prepilin-type N-terminal cleavage/methylation domain-containing protein n=1 Tax=Acerihabitans sp. TG2 TaxID=3096008 RepID=UPI002B2268E5|nr:prepilin-type N-terminal cleavage/methylation domain-containing protein [Acerihabitans sp. TG2]MEA9392513.1 prepilin-type N-terminal cleavage/methylation domain-containing protein [Acerihabitans sp. TG2]
MLKNGQAGFSLVETLCALAIVSMLVLGSLRILPWLYRQAHVALQRTQLVWQMEHSLLSIEKDVRRAGFCSPPCRSGPVQHGQHRGEALHSCLILHYAYYPADSRRSLVNDTFGYRLHRGAMETQRGVRHCNEPGWAKMHDSRRWVVKQFRCDPLGNGAWRVILAGEAKDNPTIHYCTQRIFVGRNG